MIKIYLSNVENPPSHNKILYVDNIDKADIIIGNVSVGKNNLFEPEHKVIIDIATANAKNKKIITFGYDLQLANERACDNNIKINELGLYILPQVENYLNDRNIHDDLYFGDFFYENIKGNGMIFLNNSIINIYDNNIKKVLETTIAFYQYQNNKKVDFSNFDFFNNEDEINNYININYKDSPIFNQLKISDKHIEFKLTKEEKNKNYLIGDDVFFIIKNNKTNKLLTEELLLQRVQSNHMVNIENNIPAEFGEKTNYNLNKVMNKNNSYAKGSKTFQANLKKMPLEKSAVDSGSLYEIVLNIESGGKGIVNVSNNIYKQKELYKYLIEKKKENKLDIIINASNNKMTNKLKKLLTKEKKIDKIFYFEK